MGISAPRPAPGLTGELPGRLGRPSHHGADLFEGQAEHVVEHKGKALRGGQGVDHNLEGEADRVGQQGLLLRVGPCGATDDRVGDVDGERLLAARLA